MDAKLDEKTSHEADRSEELGVNKFETQSLGQDQHAAIEERFVGAPTRLGGTDDIGGLMPPEHVRQGLNQRHLQLVALAGSIGVGLLLGSGKALHRSGPVGLLLGYSIVSTVVVAMIFVLAELSATAPTSGSYVRHATMWVDKSLGFATGWNLAYGGAVGIPGEIVACYVLVEFWNTTLSPAIFVTIFGLAILFSNLVAVRVFGEIESTFALIKIFTIVGLIIFGICIDLGAGPRGERIGFRYWADPGPFAAYLFGGASGRFVGFWYTLTHAAYAYSGVESVAMAAAETMNPRQSIPKAARRVLVRILVLYILSLFVVSLIVPSDDPGLLNSSGTASQSPFVVAARRAGVGVISHFVNAMTLLSAWSSANHGILTGSRSLYGMALDGNAPRMFLKTHRWGIPWVAVTAIAMFVPLAYTVLSSSATEIFEYFQVIQASSTLWKWGAIGVVSLRFHYGLEKQGISREELPYRSPLQPFAAWYALIGSVIILGTGGFHLFIPGHFTVSGLLSAYASPVINIALLLGYKFIRGTTLVKLEDIPVCPWIKHAQAHPEKLDPPARGWKRIVTILWA